jgi:hypothetical protein
MNNAVIVKIGNCGKSGTNKVGGIGLVVGSFAADTIE